MPNLYDSLINELKNGMNKLSNSEGTTGSFIAPKGDLPSSKTNIPELDKIIAAFGSQCTYTISTSQLLNTVPAGSTATLDNLNTATNLVQLYFQGTQSLDRILSNLIDNLVSVDLSKLPKTPKGSTVDLGQVRTDIQQILGDRKELQKSLNRALQEFGSAIDELKLEKLLLDSNAILGQLNPPPTKFDNLSTVIKNLTDHLKNAEKFFKAFSRKDEDLTGNEPGEIKQLIRNWGDAVTQIESLEQNDPIRGELSDVGRSRAAIAQTIQVHDLLEANYDYLADLLRSGDLESAGIL